MLTAPLLARIVPGGLRWRLAGWIAVVMLVCTGITFVAVYRGTGTQLRRQIDQEIAGDSAELAHNLTSSHAHMPAQVAHAASVLHQRPAVRRELHVPVRDRPRRRHEHQPPRAVRAVGARQRRDRDRAGPGEPSVRAAVDRAPGLRDAGAARRRQPARAQAHRARTRRTTGDDRRGRAAGARHPRPERRRTRIHPRWRPRARGRAVGRLSDRHARIAPAAPDGGRGGAGGCRRPAPAHRRSGRSGRGGAGAGRRVQPHARPAHRRVRRSARVRGRRLA